MATYNYAGYVTYAVSGSTATFGTRIETAGTLDDSDGALDQFLDGEAISSPLGTIAFEGTLLVDGSRLPVLIDGNIFYIFIPAGTGPTTNWSFPNPTFDTSLIDHSAFSPCFAAGTLIQTASGERPVETLSPGEEIFTFDGRTTRLIWLGRHTVDTFLARDAAEPVCISAGALGGGLPHSDLTVTADHGIVLDDMVINANALINGTTIRSVPAADLPARVTYYHLETEAHDIVLANGAPSETFVDCVTRARFDNYAEYLDLCGTDRIISAMNRPRISTSRLVPQGIRDRINVVGRKSAREAVA